MCKAAISSSPATAASTTPCSRACGTCPASSLDELTMSKIGFLHERRLFWRAFRSDYFHTGSLWPSSRYLGRELAANLRGQRPPGRILEIGAGTGPVTAQIVRHLIPGDHFDIVEINGDLVRVL